jgi:hypothetical protein
MPHGTTNRGGADRAAEIRESPAPPAAVPHATSLPERLSYSDGNINIVERDGTSRRLTTILDGGAITVVKPDGTDAITIVRGVQGSRPGVLGPTRPLGQPSARAE